MLAYIYGWMKNASNDSSISNKREEKSGKIEVTE